MSILRSGALFVLGSLVSYQAHAADEGILNFGEYIGKIYSDGSGHLGRRFDPGMTLSCKSFACEYKRNNADAETTFNNTWEFHLRIDEMTDKKIITTSRRPYKLSAEFGEMLLSSNVYLWLDLSRSDQEILCVGGHDFPGMKAMIRVNSNSPTETNEEGCISLTEDIDSQLRAASSVSIRGYHWPYSSAETMVIDLGGYSEITDYLRSER